MTRQRFAWLLVAIGAVSAVAGVGVIYLPAAAIIGGVALAAAGLFVVEIGDKK